MCAILAASRVPTLKKVPKNRELGCTDNVKNEPDTVRVMKESSFFGLQSVSTVLELTDRT